MKVCHLTSVHPRYDTRIFYKECVSLSKAGYSVSLVVADGKGDELQGGVSIVDAGVLPGRINRIFRTTQRVLEKANQVDADIYHLHDPELLPIGLSLKKRGKKVIFDSHEDVPKQILAKPYLGRFSKKLVSSCVGAYERWACAKLDGIIAATPFICEKFKHVNSAVVAINNYPMIEELAEIGVEWSKKSSEVCYVGGFAVPRGVGEIVDAMAFVKSDTKLLLAGKFMDSVTEERIKNSSGWGRSELLGFLNRDGVRDTLYRSRAGLVTLHPIINYLDALPVKMFEYMAAGIPVIASDFPLWREIIEKSKCGLLVDPMNPVSIAQAIDSLMDDSEAARLMGENGRKAVRSTYNWGNESLKLVAFYKQIFDKEKS
ncbi:glycosyltransferase family 4 protein [Pseudomonas auratipiscis]|uniref:Glycosyltransferase family 4 protein n=1 Tax=Pseudomonas auratipiscis TaxID=3115853 RepID=A0AB35WUV7_9PSED|nr:MULTISPECIES: glycosyltransferase family 4 protein [unclassified Pseudomonas]MEE1867162.1 glycosyltransferase family 4 protein [Pseudomonas sp. 120P]MEE1957989.1 glycosyltransferase family 4 protein [Pseudomonas sp. 119P]